MVQFDPAIRAFYQNRYVEAMRLTESGQGRLEFVRTQELLRRHLSPASDVLDVGGASGVHAAWLAGDGHRVVLVDPVETHVRQASAVGTFVAQVGDARELRQQDESVNAVLLLGPLYHLVDAYDRAKALAEAVRVTQPGGLVVAAGISPYAGLLEFGSNGGLRDTNERGLVDSIVTRRHHDDPQGFTNAYFHHPEELRYELQAAGLAGVEVVGVEGPAAAMLHDADAEQTARLLPSAIRLAQLVESDPRMMSTSPHLLAVGHR